MQFRRALQPLLYKMHHANPRLGPVHISKIDIADGFYRIRIKAEDALKLGVLFPAREGEEDVIGFPLTLPMGWKESPPNFSAATETVADLANQVVDHSQHPHRLDRVSETAPNMQQATPALHNDGAFTSVPTRQPEQHYHRPLAYWDMCVDDFIGLAQGNQWKRRNTKRSLLHQLDLVLRQLSPEDSPHRQEPALVSKMIKGDATWATRKIVLGWLIDTTQKTINLPSHRYDRLLEILASIHPKQKRVATQQCESEPCIV